MRVANVLGVTVDYLLNGNQTNETIWQSIGQIWCGLLRVAAVMKNGSFMKLRLQPKRVFLKTNGCSTRIIIVDYKQYMAGKERRI